MAAPPSSPSTPRPPSSKPLRMLDLTSTWASTRVPGLPRSPRHHPRAGARGAGSSSRRDELDRLLVGDLEMLCSAFVRMARVVDGMPGVTRRHGLAPVPWRARPTPRGRVPGPTREGRAPSGTVRPGRAATARVTILDMTPFEQAVLAVVDGRRGHPSWPARRIRHWSASAPWSPTARRSCTSWARMVSSRSARRGTRP